MEGNAWELRDTTQQNNAMKWGHPDLIYGQVAQQWELRDRKGTCETMMMIHEFAKEANILV